MPKYLPYITTIVDPKGVDTSISPRPMEMGSDQSRESVSKRTSGEPLVDYDGTTNPYIDYQSIDILLSKWSLIFGESKPFNKYDLRFFSTAANGATEYASLISLTCVGL